MMTKISTQMFALCIIVFTPQLALAGHPLVTDDTGTQGQGNFQLEVTGQYDHDKADGITSKGGELAATVSYGITDTIDIVIGAPYLWTEERSDDRTINAKENGISDTGIDVKIRLYEKDGLSFAVKPGISLPTGDDDKGLGAGKVGYQIFLIGTKEAGPWTLLANLAYIRNETDVDTDQKNIWHASAAVIYSVNDQWQFVADAIFERNIDKDADNDPVSTIAGVIYSLTENIDLDLGIKAGLTSSDTDWSLMAGTTFRF